MEKHACSFCGFTSDKWLYGAKVYVCYGCVGYFVQMALENNATLYLPFKCTVSVGNNSRGTNIKKTVPR